MKIKVKVLNRVYESEGETLIEAIQKIKLPKVKTHGILTYEENGKIKEKVLNAFVMRNYFGPSGISSKQIATKMIKNLL